MRLLRITVLFSISLLVMAAPMQANDALDRGIIDKSEQAEVLAEGERLFQQICASCHGKDLSGASGFNLKDGEWVHGSSPSDILNNVKKGFMNAGMPGFEMVFNEAQLQAIVAYVVANREGWFDLSYKLYQLNDENDKVISAEKLVKSGRLPKALADFSLPEVRHYFIEFEGTFYAPKDQDSQIWLEWGFPHEVEMYVDDQLVERKGRPWYPTWKLKRGKQKLKITYRSGTSKVNQRNLVLLGTNLDLTVKLFAVSTRAKSVLESKNYNITATDKTLVQRKRVHQLPPYTVSVGLPAKLNYAFNTRSCAIVGLWQGELLNIGPNIAGRGEDPSLLLGDWLFKYPQAMKSVPTGEPCRYLGYRFINGEPVFRFEIGKQTYSLRAEATSHSALTFIYQTEANQAVTLSLPVSNQLSWQYQGNKLLKQEHELMADQSGKIKLTAEIGE